MTIDVLRAGFLGLKKAAAPGIDGLLWENSRGDPKTNLGNLHERVHTGAYRALASRRRYILKADGRLRPLGIAALEDKIVQAAVVAVLTPIYRLSNLGSATDFGPDAASTTRWTRSPSGWGSDGSTGCSMPISVRSSTRSVTIG